MDHLLYVFTNDLLEAVLDILSPEQLYDMSLTFPALLSLPRVEWDVHEFIQTHPVKCTAPTRAGRCNRRFMTRGQHGKHWERDHPGILDDFFRVDISEEEEEE